MPFDSYELDLGKKVCEYSLITDDGNFLYTGLLEIFLGDNIGFCFIDNVGTTFEIMFLQKVKNLESFLKNNFNSSILDAKYSKVEINLSFNKNNTKDRANLILLNCLPNTTIKKNGDLFIDIEKIKSNINCFSIYNSYQLCFYYDDYKDFAYKKIEKIEKLNFNSLYINYHQKVDEYYDNLLKVIKEKDIDSLKINILKCQKYEADLVNIINKKYIYGAKLLENELDKEYYVDFIFKILFLIFVNADIQRENDIILNNLDDIYSRLFKNKNLICDDKLLKIYEKIFLLSDIYFSNTLSKTDYIIDYCHYDNLNKYSPLFYAYEFLKEFISNLDYDSQFYYPLLLIDGDSCNYKYEKNGCFKFITIYGFNMLSLEEIKTHLKNIIPNIIIFHPDLSEDTFAITNPLNGNIILNEHHFKRKNILQNVNKDSISKETFIVSKIMMQEIFGHKKRSYSKLQANYVPISSFKTELGELIFISENNEDCDIFKESNKNIAIENIDSFKGDSGFLIKYFFGKIETEYICALIDSIENNTNLSKLLEPKLWHKDIKTFQEYIKLKVIIVNLFPKTIIDNKLDIYEQINEMKLKIIEENDKKEGKNDKQDISNINKINKIIDEIYIDIMKSSQNQNKYKLGKGRNFSSHKNDNIFIGKNLKNSLLEGFTKGFYRK